MEFPVYQWCVARFSSATGMALDQSGRSVSILFLLATLPAIYELAALAGLARASRLLVLAAVLSSPVYLFYGRTFMIETTALCFAAWFLLAICHAVRDLNWAWALAAAIAGSLAALAKVTTFAVYCFPAAGLVLWFAWPHWKNRKDSPSASWRALVLGGLPLLISVIIGEAWVRHADAVKDANPFSGFLKSSEMVSWNWGTMDQRLSWATWNAIWAVIRDCVLGEPAAAVIIVCAAIAAAPARRLAGAGFASFIIGPLLFINLYYRHDYYYSANALPLLFAAGILLAGAWQSPILPRAAKFSLLGLFFGSQFLIFYRGYDENHRRQLPTPPEIATVIRETVPGDGVVLIYGWDWSSLIPYYSQRRAIMVPNGREDELKALEDILGQLPPLQIRGLLIKPRTPTPYSPEFIRGRLARFHLSQAPIASGADGDFYLPEGTIAAAVTQLKNRTFSQLTVNEQESADSNPYGLKDEDLGKFNLTTTSPHPIRIRGKYPLKSGDADGQPAISAHPVSEFYFTAPAAAVEIDAEFGILNAAYSAGGTAATDGVEFEIYEVMPDGLRRSLFQRYLNPAQVNTDRGLQKIHLGGAGPFTGKLVFKTTPGPKNNLTNDWAYWGEIRIH